MKQPPMKAHQQILGDAFWLDQSLLLLARAVNTEMWRVAPFSGNFKKELHKLAVCVC